MEFRGAQRSSEGVNGGHICGQRIKNGNGTKPFWNHLEKFHPNKFAELKGGDDDIVSTLTLR